MSGDSQYDFRSQVVAQESQSRITKLVVGLVGVKGIRHSGRKFSRIIFPPRTRSIKLSSVTFHMASTSIVAVPDICKS